MALIKCPGCGNDVSENAQSCPTCGEPIDTIIKCPKCGSKNIKVISGVNKAASIFAVGIFAANKVLNQYVCNDCKHKFSTTTGSKIAPPPPKKTFAMKVEEYVAEVQAKSAAENKGTETIAEPEKASWIKKFDSYSTKKRFFIIFGSMFIFFAILVAIIVPIAMATQNSTSSSPNSFDGKCDICLSAKKVTKYKKDNFIQVEYCISCLEDYIENIRK